MKDFRGQELNIGDKVAVALSSSSYCTYLEEGEIIAFCKRSGYDCATIKFNKTNSWWSPSLVNRAGHKIVKL